MTDNKSEVIAIRFYFASIRDSNQQSHIVKLIFELFISIAPSVWLRSRNLEDPPHRRRVQYG